MLYSYKMHSHFQKYSQEHFSLNFIQMIAPQTELFKGMFDIIINLKFYVKMCCSTTQNF